MGFKEINVENESEDRREKSAQFREAWDESRTEYQLISEMIRLRKKEHVTQKELATLTGNKQQVISRIERRENIPSIRMFSNILEALGYELQIVKKKER